MAISIESVFRDGNAICDDVVENIAIRPKITRLITIIITACAIYGATMGIRHSLLQAIVAAIKVPILFFVTLLICLPALHFIGLLLGSRIHFWHSLTILLMGIATTAILLASLAPISVFFLLSGSRYEFLMLMHVAIFAFCGGAGLVTIRRNFHYIRTRDLDEEQTSSNNLLLIWMSLYMFVGTQMAYILAPFVGRSSQFMLFHIPQDNFYTYLLNLITEILQ